MTSYNELSNQSQDADPDELTFQEFTDILLEVRDQPQWRTTADKEMEYKDGNQLSSALLDRMRVLGIPPATMPLIGINIEAAMGEEAKQRTDWRVTPDGATNDPSSQDIADALNFKLNKAERRSRADRACSDAYESQYSVGIGWVEVSKAVDPRNYPYRCRAVHRNQMFWDWDGYLKSPMGEEARFVGRRNWINRDIVPLLFPDKTDIIKACGSGWTNMDMLTLDGGRSTGLNRALDIERSWTIEEMEWRNLNQRMMMLYEVWYRRWSVEFMMRSPNGRVEPLDINDEDQLYRAGHPGVEVVQAPISKVRRSWWLGPHKMADEPSPYTHNMYTYVPFWGNREDRTGVPYGRIRAMMYMQDNINATLSKIRWGLSSTVTVRTNGAYLGTPAQLRNQVARVDADIVLDADHMAKPGAEFRIDRNFQLNEQQYKILVDSIASINRLGGLGDDFLNQGRGSDSAAGKQLAIEQTTVGLANIKDNFNESRATIGRILLSMIIQDGKDKTEEVTIEGRAIRPDKTVTLNGVDPVTGETINNIEEVLLNVELEDVPSTSSYREQQLAAFSEAFKSTTPNYQTLMMPHMINLMNIPFKEEIIKAMKEQAENKSPQDQLIEAQTAKARVEAVKIGAEAEFAAMQTADVVVMRPADAPVADAIIDAAKTLGDPNVQHNPVPVPQGIPQPATPVVPVNQNTSPMSPPVPAGPTQGIETPRVDDNHA